MAASGKKRVSTAGKIGIWHCAVGFFSQVPKKCTDLGLSLLYILISGTYSKFARKQNFRALGSAVFAFCILARALAAGLPHQDHVYKTTNESCRFHKKKNWWNALSNGFHWESAFVREIPNPTLIGISRKELQFDSVVWTKLIER